MPGKEGLAGRVLGILSYHSLFAVPGSQLPSSRPGALSPHRGHAGGCGGCTGPARGRGTPFPVMTPWPGGHLFCPLRPLPLPSISGALFSLSLSLSLSFTLFQGDEIQICGLLLMHSRCQKQSWPRLSSSAIGLLLPQPAPPPHSLAQKGREGKKPGRLAPPAGSSPKRSEEEEDFRVGLEVSGNWLNSQVLGGRIQFI